MEPGRSLILIYTKVEDIYREGDDNREGRHYISSINSQKYSDGPRGCHPPARQPAH